MHLRSIGALAPCVLLVTFAPLCSAERVPAYVAAAIADPGRSAKSVSADAGRKPAELLTFIGLKPGEKIVDVIPGLYFDRLFADVVGPNGHVFMFILPEYAKADNWPIPAASTPLLPGYANVTWTAAPISAFSTPEPADVVWIRHNYHDLYDPFMGPADVSAFNKAVYKALKPGGRYVIIVQIPT